MLNQNNPTKLNEIKIKAFIDKWKSLGKSREELRTAYDKAKRDWIFNLEEQQPEKLNFLQKIDKKVQESPVWKTVDFLWDRAKIIGQNVRKEALQFWADIHRYKTWRPEEMEGFAKDVFDRETARQQRVFEAQQRWTIDEDDKAFVWASILNSWVQILWDAFMRGISTLASDKEKDNAKDFMLNKYTEAINDPVKGPKVKEEIQWWKDYMKNNQEAWAREKEKSPKFAVFAEYLEELAEPIVEIATVWTGKKWLDTAKDVVSELWEQTVKKTDEFLAAWKKATLDLTEDIAKKTWDIQEGVVKKITKTKEEWAKVIWEIKDKVKEVETWLTKDQIKWLKSNPYQAEEFKKMSQRLESPEWIWDIKDYKVERVNDVTQRVTNEIDNLKVQKAETGPLYNKVRELDLEIPTTKLLDDFSKTMKVNWMDIVDWNIVRVAGSKASNLNQADISKFDQLYKDLLADIKKGYLTPSEMLDFRKTASDLAKYDAVTTWRWQSIMRKVRSNLDNIAKTEIPWLKKLDEQFVDRLSEVENAIKDLVYKWWDVKWEWRSNIVNIIWTLDRANRAKLLQRLEKVLPWIWEQIKAIDNIPSLHKALQKQWVFEKYTWFWWALAWATTLWSVVPVVWHALGAIVWLTWWRALEATLTKFRKNALTKLLSEMSEEWVSKLKNINNKIKKKEVLKQKDLDYLNSLKKQLKNEVNNNKNIPTKPITNKSLTNMSDSLGSNNNKNLKVLPQKAGPSKKEAIRVPPSTKRISELSKSDLKKAKIWKTVSRSDAAFNNDIVEAAINDIKSLDDIKEIRKMVEWESILNLPQKQKFLKELNEAEKAIKSFEKTPKDWIKNQYWDDLVNAFKKLQWDELRSKKQWTLDNFSKVEELKWFNATKFKDAAKEYIWEWDQSIQSIYDDLKDVVKKDIPKKKVEPTKKKLPEKKKVVPKKTKPKLPKKKAEPIKTSEVKRDILDELNPTWWVLVDYTPNKRANSFIDKNKLTTLDKTMWVKPDKEITIYRWAPKSQKNIVDWDFVTTNYDLAKSYAWDWHILKLKTKAKNILDDISESLWDEYLFISSNKQKWKDIKAPKVKGGSKWIFNAPDSVNLDLVKTNKAIIEDIKKKWFSWIKTSKWEFIF